MLQMQNDNQCKGDVKLGQLRFDFVYHALLFAACVLKPKRCTVVICNSLNGRRFAVWCLY
jgi:hypothetical protein